MIGDDPQPLRSPAARPGRPYRAAHGRSWRRRSARAVAPRSSADQCVQVAHGLRQARGWPSRGWRACRPPRAGWRRSNRRLARFTTSPAVGHQLRQAREEHVEARGRRADDRVLQALDRRPGALVGRGPRIRSMYSSPVTPCSCSSATVCSEIGVVESMSTITSTRAESRGSMRRLEDAADADAQVAHRRAAVEAADAAVEVDLVAVVVAVLAGVGVPVDEQRGERAPPAARTRRPRRSWRHVPCAAPSRARAPARRGSIPGSTGCGLLTMPSRVSDSMRRSTITPTRLQVRKMLSRSCVIMTMVSCSCLLQVQHQVVEGRRAHRVEPRGGLIEEQQRRVERQGARQGGALDHAAGELAPGTCAAASAGRPTRRILSSASSSQRRAG